MRMIDLFSGIGGFSLAASWVWGDDLEVVFFCENKSGSIGKKFSVSVVGAWHWLLEGAGRYGFVL